MTTELEEQFYKTFGIEPISKWHKCKDYSCVCCDEYDNCSKRKFIYPKITDRKLLEMICIANKANIEVIGETVEETKNKLLEEMVYWKDDIIYKQIQQLFKEKE